MDPSLLLSLIERLPDTSMTTALASGGRHLFGWGQDRYLAADTYDAINVNTTATGQWKSKAPKIDPYPRPKVTLPKAKKATGPAQRVNLQQIHRQLTQMAANQTRK